MSYAEEKALSRRLAGMVALVLMAGAMAAGCGSDDSSSADTSAGPPVTTSQLSKAAYVKKANAECKTVRKNLMADAGAFLNKQKGVSEEVANAKLGQEVVVPTVEAEMDAIRKLGAPAGDEEEIEAILAADQQGIDKVNELKRTESIQDVLDPFTPATKALQRYGLTSCGN